MAINSAISSTATEASFFLIFNTVGHHGIAKRTGRSNNFRSGLECFLRSLYIDIFITLFGFLEHLRPTGTTTKTSFPAILHLDQFHIELSHQFPGSLIDVVRPTQIAGIVICHAIPLCIFLLLTKSFLRKSNPSKIGCDERPDRFRQDQGISFFKVLKQCGQQAVTTFLTS